jgi:hypothetical protein
VREIIVGGIGATRERVGVVVLAGDGGALMIGELVGRTGERVGDRSLETRIGWVRGAVRTAGHG